MSPDPIPAPPAPSWYAKYRPYLVVALAILGWAIAAYHAIKSGQPLPPPPVFAPAPVAPVEDEPEPAATKRSYGWTRPPADEVPDRVFAAPAGQQLPAAVHLLNAAPVEVPADLPFDQGRLGSCGPNSAAGLLLYLEAKAGKKGLPPPSRLFIYYTTRQLMGTTSQDSGVSNSKMFKALALYGVCDEPKWPYQIERFTARPLADAFNQAFGRRLTTGESVPQNLAAMKACLAAGRPIVYGFRVYPSFETRQVELSGVVPMPSNRDRAQGPLGGHDVLITGYSDARKTFTFLNSYGPDWGQSGFGQMPYAYATNAQLSGDFWSAAESPR